MTSDNSGTDEAVRLYELLTQRFLQGDWGTHTIELAERVLDALKYCESPHVYNTRKFTQMYLAMSLNKRAVDYYVRSLSTAAKADEGTASSSARQVLADLDRAAEIACDAQMGVSINRNIQFALILDLGLYDRAFAHAQQTIDRFPDSQVGYSWLSTCYLYIHDYARALDAANEVIKRAYNDYSRFSAFQSRAGVYRAMGDEESAERDLAEAKRIYPKS